MPKQTLDFADEGYGSLLRAHDPFCIQKQIERIDILFKPWLLHRPPVCASFISA